jgi:DNA repair protein RadC
MSDSSRVTIHDLPNSERPRERLMQHGSRALSTAELLALILRTGNQDENVIQLAQRILAHYDGIRGMARITTAGFKQFKGLGDAKAARVLAAIELGRRVMIAQPAERPVVKNAEDAARLVLDMGQLDREQIRLILLDNAKKVIAIPTVYVGTVNMSILRLSEIFREAILRNSPFIILAHNHPSGDARPSSEDIKLTHALIEAGHMLDIAVVDHLIIGNQTWTSLRETGLPFG